MSRTRISRRQRERRINRVLMGMFAVVLLAGIFGHITMASRVSGQNKRAVELERDVYSLSKSVENLNLSLKQYHNLDRIAARAAQLGMKEPTETEIRVVNLPVIAENTSTQSAEAIGAEEMMN